MLLNEKRETYKGDVVKDANGYYNENIDRINEVEQPDVAAFKDKETGHYVVSIGENVFEMDEYATSPNGVNIYLGTKSELTEELGESVDVEELPESVKKAISDRMKKPVEEENDVVKEGVRWMFGEETKFAPKKKEKKVIAESKEPKKETPVVVEGSKWL